MIKLTIQPACHEHKSHDHWSPLVSRGLTITPRGLDTQSGHHKLTSEAEDINKPATVMACRFPHKPSLLSIHQLQAHRYRKT